MNPPVAEGVLEELKTIGTCAVANAIESFDVRLRNEGYADASIRRFTPNADPLVGFAVTARIRCSNPSTDGRGYADRLDWWNHVQSVAAPRVVVIQDVDEKPGAGSFLGEVHAGILGALGCVGAITNGSVRDVPEVSRTGFQFFAGSVAVSHAYVHFLEFGGSIEVGGLTLNHGDLVHADSHGVVQIPLSIAPQIPSVARKMLAREARILALCRSGGFSLEKLREAVRTNGA